MRRSGVAREHALDVGGVVGLDFPDANRAVCAARVPAMVHQAAQQWTGHKRIAIAALLWNTVMQSVGDTGKPHCTKPKRSLHALLNESTPRWLLETGVVTAL